MEMSTVRKTFKYKLRPTLDQAAHFETTLRLCRELYYAALQERRDAWKMRQVSVGYYEQKAQLPDIRQIREDWAAVNAQVLQEVVLRIDRAFKAFFRRVKAGEKPGYPRFQGRDRYHSFTFPQVGAHGCAQIDNGFLVLSKIGRIAVRWSRPLGGTPQDRHHLQRSRWLVCLLFLCRCADAALASDGRRDGHRCGAGALLDARQWRAGCQPAPLSHSGTSLEAGATSGIAAPRRAALADGRRFASCSVPIRK